MVGDCVKKRASPHVKRLYTFFAIAGQASRLVIPALTVPNRYLLQVEILAKTGTGTFFVGWDSWLNRKLGSGWQLSFGWRLVKNRASPHVKRLPLLLEKAGHASCLTFCINRYNSLPVYNLIMISTMGLPPFNIAQRGW